MRKMFASKFLVFAQALPLSMLPGLLASKIVVGKSRLEPKVKDAFSKIIVFFAVFFLVNDLIGAFGSILVLEDVSL